MKLKILAILFICISLSSCAKKNVILGLDTSTFFYNLKRQGFIDEILEENNNKITTHISKKYFNRIKYEIITTNDTKNIYNYKVTITSEYDLSNDTKTFLFLQNISSVSYNGSNPEAIKNWLIDNYNKNKADTIIGGVNFKIESPTLFVKLN